ncbi:GNAT family N-acetyltransferase [Patulibacter minatonensis]|uniref:GNAT family N-acetyltransferase n=1 Tax=Patulibacter minatonensis TaxID=298163 RepID=UPI000685817C|nr:GNAT family protein [Patulibacter minatonensis]
MTADPSPDLRGDRVRLRPVTRADAPVLRAFLDDPEVGRWWPPPPEDEDFPFDEPDLVVLTIEADGRVAGLIQFLEELEPDYRHASIDVFLGAGFHGRGLGPDAVATAVRHLILDRGHHRVTIDPTVANARAVAAYRRVGFRDVGVLREHEFDHEAGAWRDGLLMDLLASDLGLTPGSGSPPSAG